MPSILETHRTPKEIVEDVTKEKDVQASILVSHCVEQYNKNLPFMLQCILMIHKICLVLDMIIKFEMLWYISPLA